MKKYKPYKIRLGKNSYEYSILRWSGGEWVISRPIKYYKTKAGVMKEIKKRRKN